MSTLSRNTSTFSVGSSFLRDDRFLRGTEKSKIYVEGELQRLAGFQNEYQIGNFK